MITMNEFMDLRMQQHIAHEIYRHQIMQRIPDPFPPILPIQIPGHITLPHRVGLQGAEVSLQNYGLWKLFHNIGTEMIITKSGRRMFPSMRLSISGLEDDTNYCILLEMVPVGDCRYKFSGSHWVPAGGAEPQSPQRMYLHTDSPASGAHWQAQPILFNKVKLTNNTLDNNGHIVLASMHKYQPRIHVIRTSDPLQIPWSPQQAFIFQETEFVAVTAYQNDRITKLKIDNNPFAKGFRETGQSRCKRKMSTSRPMHSVEASDLTPSTQCNVFEIHQNENYETPSIKRQRSNGSTCSVSSLDDVVFSASISSNNSSGKSSPNIDQIVNDIQACASPKLDSSKHIVIHDMKSPTKPSFVDLAYSYFGRTQYHLQMYPNSTDHNSKDLPYYLQSAGSLYKLQCASKDIHVHINKNYMGVSGEGDGMLKTTKSNNFSISAILGSKS